MTVRYELISADCHIDLGWLPPDLFVANAAPALRDRMPYVTEGPQGPMWVTTRGAMLGLVCGMGSAGHRQGARPPAGGRAVEDRVRERAAALWLRVVTLDGGNP